MQRLKERLDKAASVGFSVLLIGPNGAGKSLLAAYIHRASRRSEGPFWRIDCATLSETLLLSELFGHVKGAFSSADKTKKGLVELADGGVVFLDEIDSMPLDIQKGLLDFIQHQEFRHVGGIEKLHADVRIVAATKVDLSRRVVDGKFREDLYHRLNVICIRVPPLCERAEDVPDLVEHFVGYYSKETNTSGWTIAPEDIAALQAYPWPGNVRELENAVQRGLAFAPDNTLRLRDMLPEVAAERPQIKSLEQVKDEYIEHVLQTHHWDQTRAAKALGIGRSTISRWVQKFVARQPAPADMLALAEIEVGHLRRVYEQCGRNRAMAAGRLGVSANTISRRLKEETAP